MRTQIVHNPFVFGSPVRGREQFFGRDSIVQRVMSRLESMQDSSIIGERRMGKTSLLYHLADPAVQRAYGIDAQQYRFIYFSFEGSSRLTPSAFWQRLLKLLSNQVSQDGLHSRIEELRARDDIDPQDVEDLFSDIAETGLRVVFLLDEFETVTQAVNLDADFFGHLRSLAIGQFVGLIFVTSSRQRLSELSHAGIVGSPFFNIFETFFLQPLEPAATDDMLTDSLVGTGVSFSDVELEYLVALTGRHPYFLQMAASYLFDAYAVHGLTGPTLSSARLERVERDFMGQAQAHFEHYWKVSTDHERIFLAALAAAHQGRPEQPADMETMKKAYRDADVAAGVLADRGLVARERGVFQTFSPAYERWIVQELTGGSSRGDYLDWLQQNQREYGGQPGALRSCATEIGALVDPRYWSLVTRWLSKAEDPDRLVNLLGRAADPATSPDRPIWFRFLAN